jgi:hypothetical protein
MRMAQHHAGRAGKKLRLGLEREIARRDRYHAST